MKIPEPKKLPSGRWRIQIMQDGHRISRTFDTEKEALYWATGVKVREKEVDAAPQNLTVSAAVNRYIESKSAILSPSTIAGYRKIQKNLMTMIATVKLGDLTQERVQRWVNTLAKSKAPKTIGNAHGLLSAVLAEYRPSMALHTTLPQKVKAEIQIPTEAELTAILKAAAGTKYELPIYLAAWMGLRQSEILGLTWDCIKDNHLNIKRAIVMGEDGPTEKGTKTYSGTRSIRIPAQIKELFDLQPRTNEHIVTISGKAIYSGFSRICEKAGVPHFRFHDLRHANASAMLALGIPDKYSMKRMGHATNYMLKTTYQHTIKEKEKEFDDRLDAYFEAMIKPE